MMPESDKYLDILKVLEFGAEGGGEALFRLLPYGSSNFVWRTYGNSIGEDDSGEEVWEDFSNEYEDIVEYLIERNEMLASFYPLYVDASFRDQVFAGFIQSLRAERNIAGAWLFGESNLFGNWPEWQKLLQLTANFDKIELYSAIGRNPIEKLTLDYSRMHSVQMLLNCIYNALLLDDVPHHTYGRRWKIYDLVNCRELQLPRDDRDDSLSAVGVTSGGIWIAYQVDK